MSSSESEELGELGINLKEFRTPQQVIWASCTGDIPSELEYITLLHHAMTVFKEG